MKLRYLINSLADARGPQEPSDLPVTGVTADSREVQPGFIFVAVKGAKEDGAGFIREAISKGAAAVVGSSGAERTAAGAPFFAVKDPRLALAILTDGFYRHPSGKLKVAGITGTNGKTTVTYLLEAIARENARVPAVIGTINYRYQGRIISARNTTPGPREINSLLDQMSGAGVEYVFMEVSSHALEQQRVQRINFHSAIFTNLTQDHLDYHGDLENYFLAKNRLFKELPGGSFAVLNDDDPYTPRIKADLHAVPVTYGIDSRHAEFSAGEIKLGVAGTQFLLQSPAGRIGLQSKLIGRHNIYNLLAAAAWAIKAGFDLTRVIKAIEGFNGVPGRMEAVNTDRDFAVFVDYAHTDDALKNVISALREICRGRIIVVFGCGGDRDRLKRPKMGAVSSALADFVIVTSDNPRSEDPARIIKEITKGIKKDNFLVEPDRRQAIKKSLSMAGAGDIILIAGKGHEDYQVFKDTTVHFDDREEVKACLKAGN
ncbi:MAG: UDP-N-acetylmuramoyl-L-alanyl-D-glutamate--2,6-diaminopimelate ligase [Candidatus Omnitrophica bacterium]|nr:UDP-N-acetylmuramoyl-L-alanyl-D-glutamate--2,6-diaminopimelate ligase [Candidatus Omnitrophota bacterium]MDD5513003.1 UDP-N-acetylmuramoyl-L-alanyl-D-glutamate--2,6-diaminopimelate ligase [Candidatus Omnitrophota bacterium]